MDEDRVEPETDAKDSELDPALVEFVKKWSLDSQSIDFIHRLDGKVRQAVLAEFNPPPDTRSVAAMLRSFARGEERRKGAKSQPRQGPRPAARGARSRPAAPTKPSPIGALPPRSRAEGPPGLQPPSNSSAADVAEAPEAASAEAKAQAAAGEDAPSVTDFVQKWGLGTSSGEMLQRLPKSVLEKVLANFAPAGSIRNMDAKLQAYVRTLASKSKVGQSQPAANPLLRSFCKRVGLDSRSETLLQSLSTQQLHIVFRDFQPPLGSAEVNRQLAGFVKSLKRPGSSYFANGSTPAATLGAATLGAAARARSSHAGSTGALGKSGNRGLAARSVGARPREKSRRGPGYTTKSLPKPDGKEEDKALGSSLADFESKWGLDEDAKQALHELPQELLNEVLAEFQPPADTANMSGRLQAFVRRKAKAAGPASRNAPRQLGRERQKRAAVGEAARPRGAVGQRPRSSQGASPARLPPGLSSEGDTDGAANKEESVKEVEAEDS